METGDKVNQEDEIARAARALLEQAISDNAICSTSESKTNRILWKKNFPWITALLAATHVLAAFVAYKIATRGSSSLDATGSGVLTVKGTHVPVTTVGRGNTFTLNSDNRSDALGDATSYCITAEEAGRLWSSTVDGIATTLLLHHRNYHESANQTQVYDPLSDTIMGYSLSPVDAYYDQNYACLTMNTNEAATRQYFCFNFSENRCSRRLSAHHHGRGLANQRANKLGFEKEQHQRRFNRFLSGVPSGCPTSAPAPTGEPSPGPTTDSPSMEPSMEPTSTPTPTPTGAPTAPPSSGPTSSPTTPGPTSSPTSAPTSTPTVPDIEGRVVPGESRVC